MMSYTPVAGDYGVVRSNGIFARLIQIGTVSRWNHAVIYIGHGLIVEANPTDVALSKVDKYNLVAWNRHEELTEEQRLVIVQAAKDAVGKPYDFIDIVVLALRILGLKLISNNWLVQKLAKRDGYICSELVAAAYDKAGISLVNKPDNMVTPGDLAERLIYQ